MAETSEYFFSVKLDGYNIKNLIILVILIFNQHFVKTLL